MMYLVDVVIVESLQAERPYLLSLLSERGRESSLGQDTNLHLFWGIGAVSLDFEARKQWNCMQ